MEKTSPIMMALICVVAWSFIPIVSKVGQVDVDGFQFLFLTNLLSCLAVGLTINPMKKDFMFTIRKTNYKLTLILGFLGCFFYYLCLYYGYAFGDFTEVLVVQYLWPALVCIFSVFILNEKLNIYKILSIFFGFLAAIIVFTKGDIFSVDFSSLSVLLIVFIGAISFSLFSVLSKLEKIQNFSYSVFMYFLWATIFSGGALIYWSEFIIPDMSSILVIVINGVFINGLSYILWIRALAREDASKIAPLVYLSPVLSIIWAALIFNEGITMVNLLAIVLVIFSGLLVTKEDRIIPKYIITKFR